MVKSGDFTIINVNLHTSKRILPEGKEIAYVVGLVVDYFLNVHF